MTDPSRQDTAFTIKTFYGNHFSNRSKPQRLYYDLETMDKLLSDLLPNCSNPTMGVIIKGMLNGETGYSMEYKNNFGQDGIIGVSLDDNGVELNQALALTPNGLYTFCLLDNTESELACGVR